MNISDIVELAPEYIFHKKDGVDYSCFKKYHFFSKILGKEMAVNILLPPNYSKDKKYPVLYALHGYFENEDWMTGDEIGFNILLSNLYESGEAKEMIVVSPYVFCSRESEKCTEMTLSNSLCYDNFINVLKDDLMPFIENNFSVKSDRENTAITGISMGGREALFIGFKLPRVFGYVGAVAPAPGLVPVKGSPDHPGQLADDELIFNDISPYVLLLSASKSDMVVEKYPESYHNLLLKNNVEHIWHEMQDTGHDHTSLKPHLYNFCRMIF